ncbi:MULTISPECIES: hypothetical protein [Asticcacaulis]|uniref:hypothetical protein n=1 Tax=Asticcacaulis TaxID=76890 RepID=UPI001AEAB16D|nr:MULTISPECIES: hypothetical protein [Asticcacaulis]MBP2157466.1 ABC-type glycerol-3-phosphate transport system substrate-binding protein [Asticcacaulis solisilvae]MDR6798511.1 ABC-type glycerol-3-phosphate transport system substrate-binding protein [Asticcacaulis sp. BE141]
MKKLITLSLLSGIALSLAACGGGSGGGGSTVVVTPPAPEPNAKYGAAFAAAAKADANSEPASVSAGDVVAVDPSAEPAPL